MAPTCCCLRGELLDRVTVRPEFRVTVHGTARARTLTDCVAEKLRRKYYDPGGPRYPDGSPRRPSSPAADGPRPEVSYDPANGFKPVESGSEPGMPSSQAPIKGAPRPDIS